MNISPSAWMTGESICGARVFLLLVFGVFLSLFFLFLALSLFCLSETTE